MARTGFLAWDKAVLLANMRREGYLLQSGQTKIYALDRSLDETEASYEFYGVVVKVRSNVEEVLSRFSKSYQFFRLPDGGQPHLEITLLAGDGGLSDPESAQIYAWVPAGFDAWRGSLQRLMGADTPLGRHFQQNIQ